MINSEDLPSILRYLADLVERDLKTKTVEEPSKEAELDLNPPQVEEIIVAEEPIKEVVPEEPKHVEQKEHVPKPEFEFNLACFNYQAKYGLPALSEMVNKIAGGVLRTQLTPKQRFIFIEKVAV